MKTRHPSSVSIKYEGKVIAENVTRANNFWTRLSGEAYLVKIESKKALELPAEALPPEVKEGDFVQITEMY